MIIKQTFLVASLLSSSVLFAQKQVPFRPNSSGVKQALELEQLPYRKTGMVCKQTSSMNKKGGNEDRRCYPYLNVTKEEAVLMEEFGPGCLFRIQNSSSWDEGAFIKINIDGEEVVNMSCDEFFSMKAKGFPAPLVANRATSSGSSFSYVPMVFHKYCKVSLSKYENKNHFQVQYHKYADVPNVPAYSKNTKLSDLNKLWNSGGTLLPYFAKTKAVKGKVTVKEGRNQLRKFNGAGTMAGMKIKLPEDFKVAAKCRLQITWDDVAKPQIDVPLGLFFSGAVGYKPYKSLLVGIDEDGVGFFNYPMPFWKSAKIELKNDSGTTFPLEYQFYMTKKAYAKNAGYLNAWYHEEKPSTKHKDYKLLEAKGWGHWVATHHLMEGGGRPSFLEGDERVYYDKMQTPALHGSGYEDFFNGSYYFQFGEFSLPMAGVPMMRHIYETSDGWGDRIISERMVKGLSHIMAYRHMLTDWVPFGDGIIAGTEVGPHGDQQKNYESVSFYYGKPQAKLIKTDEFDIGNAAAEKSHQYKTAKATAYSKTSTYEGDHDDVKISDKGNKIDFGGATQFTLKINKKNIGVRLRRRMDYAGLNQKAKVFIDGKEAGIWFLAGNNEFHSFRDDEFLIPTEFTKGKSQISVKIEPIALQGDVYKDGQQPNPKKNSFMPRKVIKQGAWTEFSYAAYCEMR